MEKQEKNGNRVYKNSYLLFKKVSVFLKLSAMLVPGIVLDIVYRFHHLLKSIRELAAQFGITYHGAFTILSGHTGMLMTMVSLFLTMNIQIAERAEKKVYGISRKELPDMKHERLYKLSGQMACAAPLLFLVFLNFYLCFSGYLLLFYCYLFLFIHFYKHWSSYSIDLNQKAVICKLASCFSSEEIDAEQILQYRLLLENIGRSAEEDGVWLELETMYYQLLEWQDYNDEGKYIISYYFYSVIFGKHNKNQVISIQMLKRYMRETDRESAEKGWMPDGKWPVLWGMLKAAFFEADDEHLSIFLQWFLNFPERSSLAYNLTGKTLPILALKEQSGMLLVLSEYRLRKIGLQSSYLERQLQTVRDYGKVTMQSMAYQCLSKIRMINQLELEDTIMMEEVIMELENDYCNYSRKCIITNL